ncbi:MAG: prevent-host-death protein [Bacteroidota bacterium]
MTQLLEQTLRRLQALPARDQDRIAAALQEELDRLSPVPEPKDERTPGLGEGRFEVPDDFTAPLPDAFWLGKG